MIAIPQGTTLKVRFQKQGGLVICPVCQRFLGLPPCSNGLVNEAKIGYCPVDGSKGKLVHFMYTGKTLAVLTDDATGKTFKGKATTFEPDVFTKSIGYLVAANKAIVRYTAWAAAQKVAPGVVSGVVNMPTQEQIEQAAKMVSDAAMQQVMRNSNLRIQSMEEEEAKVRLSLIQSNPEQLAAADATISKFNRLVDVFGSKALKVAKTRPDLFPELGAFNGKAFVEEEAPTKPELECDCDNCDEKADCAGYKEGGWEKAEDIAIPMGGAAPVPAAEFMECGCEECTCGDEDQQLFKSVEKIDGSSRTRVLPTIAAVLMPGSTEPVPFEKLPQQMQDTIRAELNASFGVDGYAIGSVSRN